MKQITALAMALVLVLGLAGCGADDYSIGVIGGADGPTAIIVGEISDEADGPRSDEILAGGPSDEPDAAASAVLDDDLERILEDAVSITGDPLDEVILTAPAEDEWYYTADEVTAYLIVYGELPENYITNDEANDLGWQGGSVEQYLDGAAIGGDRFGNREGLLPKEQGRTWYECDIDTEDANSRGAKRLVFSNDGLIYYTDDHYESFTLLYGEE